MWEVVGAGVNPIDQYPPPGSLYGTKVHMKWDKDSDYI